MIQGIWIFARFILCVAFFPDRCRFICYIFGTYRYPFNGRVNQGMKDRKRSMGYGLFFFFVDWCWSFGGNSGFLRCAYMVSFCSHNGIDRIDPSVDMLQGRALYYNSSGISPIMI